MTNEVLGITATLFVLLAFLQRGEWKIRIFDGVGALLFIVYGVLIHSFSTILLNFVLVIIQCWKLYNYSRKV